MTRVWAGVTDRWMAVPGLGRIHLVCAILAAFVPVVGYSEIYAELKSAVHLARDAGDPHAILKAVTKAREAAPGWEGGLGAGFGLGAQTLGQGVQGRVVHAHAPFVGQRSRFGLRSRGRDGEGPLAFQCQASLRAAAQVPALPNRAAPAPVAGVLAVEHGQLNQAGCGVRLYRARPLVRQALAATPPCRSASSSISCWSRWRVHSRPSAATAGSISRSDNGRASAGFNGVPFWCCTLTASAGTDGLGR